mgnify:CR=1 FL=1
MTTTYTWTFNPLEHEDRDGLSSVVTVIHWQVSGTDGTHEGRAIGTHACDAPGEEFTSWEDLTPEIVKGWLPDETITDAEAAVQNQIDRAAELATKNAGKGVPWA